MVSGPLWESEMTYRNRVSGSILHQVSNSSPAFWMDGDENMMEAGMQ